MLACSVEDAALVIEALSGHDPRDPFALGERADPLPAARRPIGGWRIAYRPDFSVFPGGAGGRRGRRRRCAGP